MHKTIIIPHSNEEDKKIILREYRKLLKAIPLYKLQKNNNRELVRHAFEMAAEAHKTMRRKSGEPYITHPLTVAFICVQEIGMGVRTVICALLHDTIEDTDITLNDIEREFGKEIALIVDGLTKIDIVVDTKSSQQIETYKKILFTLTSDPRVILIKMADRLHNMRTLSSMNPDKKIKIASETAWIYVPLAHRLGLHAIKTELEDLSMKYLDPESYHAIADKLMLTKATRNKFIADFIKPLKEQLKLLQIPFEIYGRPKSISSIANKIKNKGVTFEEIYDLFAIRIIINCAIEKEKDYCWQAYSIITKNYKTFSERLRDWITNPKSNGYEALHTTIMGPNGKWIEIQIRTKRMNDIAEKGFAAHFKYKGLSQEEDQFDRWLKQIRENIANSDEESTEFLETFKTSFLSEEIYVYTPKGDVRRLPTSSTVLDFAFDIHTEIGSKCIGAKVNHTLVGINHKLYSGDQIEIITSNKQKPLENWLTIVVTAKAKSKIKDILKENKRTIGDDGKNLLEEKLHAFGAAFNDYNIEQLLKYYKVSSSLDLFYNIAIKNIDLKELKEFTLLGNRLEFPHGEEENDDFIKKKITTAKNDSEIIVFGADMDKISYTLAKCCSPIPGDDIFGYISAGKILTIHRMNCPNASQLFANYAHKIIKTKWGKNKEISFLTGIKIIGTDDVGIVNKITKVISADLHLNIQSLYIDTKDGVFDGNVKIFVHDKEELEDLVRRLKLIDGINQINRYDEEKTEKYISHEV